MDPKATPNFRVFVPLQAVGASLVYFDIFNHTDTGHNLLLNWCIPVVSGATAVTGAVSVDLFLQRTTAIGTGGTAATRNGTSLTAMTITGMSPGQGETAAGVSGRLTPTGGATAGAVISWGSYFSEETNAGTYLAELKDLVRRGYSDAPSLIVPPNTGFMVIQGGTASVGNVGFDIGYSLVPKG